MISARQQMSSLAESLVYIMKNWQLSSSVSSQASTDVPSVSVDMTVWWQILFQRGCWAEHRQPQQVKLKLDLCH